MPRGNKKENPNASYKGYKFEIRPTKEQIIFFEKSFGCCRFVWNQLLGRFFETGEFITPAKLKPDYPFLKEVDSLALANVQLDLQKAFTDHKNNPDHFGLPKFKKKHCHKKSYTTNRNEKSDTINVQYNKETKQYELNLPKLNTPVQIMLHRPLPQDTVIKTATISKAASGRYYVSLKLESENQPSKSTGYKIIGLDMAMRKLYVDSNGCSAQYPQFYREAEEKLAKEQRKLARMTKGSNHYIRQKMKIARLHEHIANQRKDFLHKLSKALADENDVIVVEDLDMSAMSKAMKLGKSVHDLGWGMFVKMLEYKLKDRGKTLVKADRWFASSQTCSVCGHKNTAVKDLSVREWECPHCHTHHDRDTNAAVNLRYYGYNEIFGCKYPLALVSNTND